MKYYLILFFLSVFSHSANCQIDKGYWLAGGSGSVYYYNDDFTRIGEPTISGKLTEINLSGNVGYFILDKFAIGLRPGINSIRSNDLNTASVGTKDVSLFIGPFVRYYFLNSEKIFNILLDGTYQVGSLYNYGGRSSIKNFSVMTGTELFFNSAVGFEILFGYLHRSIHIKDTSPGYDHKKNGIYMSIGFQFHLIND